MQCGRCFFSDSSRYFNHMVKALTLSAVHLSNELKNTIHSKFNNKKERALRAPYLKFRCSPWVSPKAPRVAFGRGFGAQNVRLLPKLNGSTKPRFCTSARLIQNPDYKPFAAE